VNPSLPYDALARRAKGKGADSMPAFTTSGAAAGGSDGEGGAAPVSARSAGGGAAKLPPKEVVGEKPAGAAPAAKAAASGMAPKKNAAAPAAAGGAGSLGAAAWVGFTGTPQQQLAALRKHVTEQDSHIAELRETCSGLEKERDFYFSKLRDIEILLQGYEGNDKATADKILAIMYATGDAGDFQTPAGAPEGGSSS
jgi:EB1-like C-terminal motif